MAGSRFQQPQLGLLAGPKSMPPQVALVIAAKRADPRHPDRELEQPSRHIGRVVRWPGAGLGRLDRPKTDTASKAGPVSAAPPRWMPPVNVDQVLPVCYRDAEGEDVGQLKVSHHPVRSTALPRPLALACGSPRFTRSFGDDRRHRRPPRSPVNQWRADSARQRANLRAGRVRRRLVVSSWSRSREPLVHALQ